MVSSGAIGPSHQSRADERERVNPFALRANVASTWLMADGVHLNRINITWKKVRTQFLTR